jgi:hypothetical protein
MSPVLEAGQNIAKRTLQEVAAQARVASATQVNIQFKVASDTQVIKHSVKGQCHKQYLYRYQLLVYRYCVQQAIGRCRYFFNQKCQKAHFVSLTKPMIFSFLLF